MSCFLVIKEDDLLCAVFNEYGENCTELRL